jgi:hypothetical protein
LVDLKIYFNFLTDGRLQSVAEMKTEIKTKCGNQCDSEKFFAKMKEKLSSRKGDLKLYEAYLERYGYWRVQRFEDFLFQHLFEVDSSNDINPLKERNLVFDALVESGFIKN